MPDDKKTKKTTHSLAGLTTEDLATMLRSSLEKSGCSIEVRVKPDGEPMVTSPITGDLGDALMSKGSASGSAQGE